MYSLQVYLFTKMFQNRVKKDSTFFRKVLLTSLKDFKIFRKINLVKLNIY